MKKKKRGILDDFLPTLIFLMLMAIMIFLFIGYNKAINQKTTLNSIARQYLLEMETSGYMTSEMKTNLVRDLNNAGFSASDGSNLTVETVDMNGTTFRDVGYGNRIQITINVYTKNMVLASDDGKTADQSSNWNMMAPKFKDVYKPISITYKSTSKE